MSRKRRHHQMRRAVAPVCLELEHDLSGGVDLHALVGQCWTRNVAAQSSGRVTYWRLMP